MNTEAPTNHDLGITRHWLQKSLFMHLASVHEAAVGGDAARHHLRVVAMLTGRDIEQRLRRLFPHPSPPTVEQFSFMLTVLGKELQIPFTIEQTDASTITLTKERCPWDLLVNEMPGYCYVMSCIYGSMAARHFGYARVFMEEPSDSGGPCRLCIYLQPGEPSDANLGEEFTQEEITDIDETSVADVQLFAEMMQKHQREGGYETRYHRQLELTDRLARALEMERSAAEALRSLNRLKQDFLSNVSHEFRTPITAIQGYLTLLEQGEFGKITAEQGEAIDITLRNIDRLDRLVRDVLDFASLSRGEFLFEGKPVDVQVILHNAITLAEEQAQSKGITVQSQYAGVQGQVVGDEERLIFMVAHLLENAIKFSETGQQVLLAARAESSHVVIEVIDPGIGMTPEQLQQVFTPFVQGESGLSRRYGGLGMGLSLIQNLVSLHGGDIHIISALGQGTTVTVSLPLLAASASFPHDAAPHQR